MKILKSGNTLKEGKCYNCGCLIQYVDTDIYTGEGGTGHYYKYVKCPECNANLFIKNGKFKL